MRIQKLMTNVKNDNLEPKNVIASGDRSFDRTCIEARVTNKGIEIDTRTGIDKETISLRFEEIVSITRNQFLSYGLTLQTDGTEYELVNVTPDADTIDSIVQDIRNRARIEGDDSGPNREKTADIVENKNPDSATTAAEELEQWADLYERGVLTESEFEQKKQELL